MVQTNMVDAVGTLIGVGLLAFSLRRCVHRAIIAGRLYRSVSTSENRSPSTLVDGEKVAIEGTVNVRDPPPLSDSLSIDEEESIWRTCGGSKESESYNYNLDAEEPGADMQMITYASGIESGTFTVDDGRREIRIDTDWLTETHDSDDITTVSPDGRYRPGGRSVVGDRRTSSWRNIGLSTPVPLEWSTSSMRTHPKRSPTTSILRREPFSTAKCWRSPEKSPWSKVLPCSREVTKNRWCFPIKGLMNSAAVFPPRF